MARVAAGPIVNSGIEGNSNMQMMYQGSPMAGMGGNPMQVNDPQIMYQMNAHMSTDDQGMGGNPMQVNDPQIMYQMNAHMSTDDQAAQIQMMYQGNMWAQALGMAELQAQQIIAEGGTVTEMALHNMAQAWMQASMQVNAQEWQAQQQISSSMQVNAQEWQAQQHISSGTFSTQPQQQPIQVTYQPNMQAPMQQQMYQQMDANYFQQQQQQQQQEQGPPPGFN